MSDAILCPHCQTELTGLARIGVKSIIDSKRGTGTRILCPACGRLIQTKDIFPPSPEREARRHAPGICWFCGTRQAEILSASTVPMYKVLSRSAHRSMVSGVTTAETKYEKQTVKVPRCADCATKHKRLLTAQLTGCLSGVIVGFLLFAAISLFVGGQSLGNLLFEACAVGALLGTLGFLFGMQRAKLPPGIEQESVGNEHPLVLDMIKEGWSIGIQPSNQPKKRRW